MILRCPTAILVLSSALASQAQLALEFARTNHVEFVLANEESFSVTIDGERVEIPFGEIDRILPDEPPGGWTDIVVERRDGTTRRGRPTAGFLSCTTVRGGERILLSRVHAIRVLDDRGTRRIAPDLAKHLILHWPLDVVGDEAPDMSPAANSGQVAGIVKPTAGVVGDAIAFDHSGSHLRCAPVQELDIPGDLTISLWVKLDTWNGHGEGGICAKGKPGEESWALVTQDDRISFLRRYADGKQWAQVDGSVPIRPGTWQHVVACSRDRDLEIWIDGIRARAPLSTNQCDTNEEPFVVGARSAWSGNFEWGIRGAIDDLFVFDRALTPDEMEMLRRRAIPNRRLPVPTLLEQARAGLGMRHAFERWIEDGTLHDGITLSDAITLLGAPTSGSLDRVVWYWNDRGMHVWPSLEAERDDAKLTHWRVVLR
ncbi:MAG: LamG domain-containing protein [Planctomycetes bacterium]|nr:LamG domain-containing protein [Planctomycetota bacterium]